MELDFEGLGEKVNELKNNREKFFTVSSENKRDLIQEDSDLRDEIFRRLLTSTRVSKEIIKRQENEIRFLKKRQRELKEERWVDITESQNDLFGTKATQSLFRKDLNAKQRKKVDRQLKEAEKKLQEYQKSRNEKLDENVREDIQKLASWNPYKPNHPAEFFDPKWMFGVEKFDIVIGNPPYVQVRNTSEKLKKIYPKSKYYKYAKGGRLNLYQFFIPASSFLVKEKGIVCLITQNSILSEDTAINTRKFIFENSKPIEFVSFPERDNRQKRVFEGVKMSVAISLFQKHSKIKEDNEFTVKTYEERHMLNMFCINLTKSDVRSVYPNKLIIPMARKQTWRLLQKFHIIENKINFRAQAGEIDMSKYKKYFHKTTGIRVYTGAQILRYKTTNTPSQGSVIYLPNNFVPQTPKTQARFKNRIVLQRITGVDSKRRLVMTIIPPNSLCANSTNFITFNNEEEQLFSLGVLNSKYINFIFKITSTNTNITTTELNNLKIPNYSEMIANNVKKILVKKSNNEDTTILEKEVDKLVYELYELTDEEIEFIEKKTE